MTTLAGRRVPASAPARELPAEAVVAGRAFRQVRTGAVLVGLTVGLSVVATAKAYLASYPTAASREQAARAVSGDAGLRILLGPIDRIATVGGYTVYKNFVFLTTLTAVWAALAGTRVLRGEEDAGRWQLQLAGATRPARATAASLLALAAGVGVVLVLGTGIALAVTADPALGMGVGGTLLYGLTLAAVPAVFAAVGAAASQVARTRRAATTLALGVLGAAFVLRMLGDAGAGWVAWLTPFGWAELVAPYSQDDALPLLLSLAVTALLAAGAVVAAGRRDVGSGLLAPRDALPPRPYGLASPEGLALRLELPALTGWVVGAVTTGVVLGVFSKVAVQSLPPSVTDTLSRYGVRGAQLEEFLGICFLLLAGVVAMLPAGQVAALAAEETSGRVVALLSRPVGRVRWYAGRLLLAASGVLLAAVLGAGGVWVGARSQGVAVSLPTLLGAGLNVVPTALVALGIGAIAAALAPRTAGAVVYAVVVWSFFADLLAPLTGTLRPLQRLSLFDSLALFPGQDARPVTLTVTALLALGLCAAAVAVFARRDLRGD